MMIALQVDRPRVGLGGIEGAPVGPAISWLSMVVTPLNTTVTQRPMRAMS
jgi:hypothetical protein